MKTLKIAILINLFASFSHASVCVETDHSLQFCQDPKAFICSGGSTLYEQKFQKNLKTIRDYSTTLFFENNRELLERHGIYEIDETAFNKLEKIMVQCHQTDAEIEGVCEDSKFFGLNLETLYSSTKNQKTTFKEQFLIDVEISFIDAMDDIAYKNEEKLMDVSSECWGTFKMLLNVS